MKIAIIGIGRLGSILAYSLALQKTVEKLVLVDPLSPSLASGHALDIQHALTMTQNVEIIAGDYEDLADCDVIVLTCGKTRKENESRLDLTLTNVEITKEVVLNVVKYNQKAILIIANNPVDITTYVAFKISGFAKEKVLGTGTFLDSLRFRYFLAEKANLDPESVDAIIIGEHGDSSVPILSTAKINGLPLEVVADLNEKSIEEIMNKVKDSGSKLLKLKGGSSFAPALSIVTIISAINNNKGMPIPLSTYLEGEYGLNDICFSVPVIVGKNGIEKIIDLKLTAEENRLLSLSAGILKSELGQIK